MVFSDATGTPLNLKSTRIHIDANAPADTHIDANAPADTHTHSHTHTHNPPPQWDSLATTAPLGTIALSPAQGNLHDISLLYKCANVSNGCGISLQWDHLPSPSTLASPPSGPAASIKTARVPYAQTLERSDVPNHLGHLLVLPAPPCGARSFLRGSALTLATAGVQVVCGLGCGWSVRAFVRVGGRERKREGENERERRRERARESERACVRKREAQTDVRARLQGR